MWELENASSELPAAGISAGALFATVNMTLNRGMLERTQVTVHLSTLTKKKYKALLCHLLEIPPTLRTHKLLESLMRQVPASRSVQRYALGTVVQLTMLNELACLSRSTISLP